MDTHAEPTWEDFRAEYEEEIPNIETAVLEPLTGEHLAEAIAEQSGGQIGRARMKGFYRVLEKTSFEASSRVVGGMPHVACRGMGTE